MDDDFPRGPGDGDFYGYPGQAEAEKAEEELDAIKNGSLEPDPIKIAKAEEEIPF